MVERVGQVSVGGAHGGKGQVAAPYFKTAVSAGASQLRGGISAAHRLTGDAVGPGGIGPPLPLSGGACLGFWG
eukprot:scaffold1443_cov116-Isochrysis_galbana.AAC.7